MKNKYILVRTYYCIKNFPFPVLIGKHFCACPEPLAKGNHFVDGLNPKMADVPDNAPERECLNKITGIVVYNFI